MGRVQMPSSNTRLNFVINDFSGGLVNNVNDVKMMDNQSPDMLNMQFRNDGLLQKRPGTIYIASLDGYGDLIDYFPYEYAPNKHLMMYYTTQGLYYHNPEHGYVCILKDTKGVDLKFEHFMGTLLFTDTLKLYCFDYNNNKFYIYKDAPEDFTPAEKPAVIGVMKEEELYTDVQTGMKWYKKWYEPCQYEMEDGYKGIGVMPPMFDNIKVHKDRLYVTCGSIAPNMVFISEILNPCYFPSSLPIQTPPNGDYITALHTYGDSLIIGRRDSIYALFGNTNRQDNAQQYNLVEVTCHTGMANQHSADNIYHMMFFVGSDGNFYKLNPPTTAKNVLYTTKLNNYIDLTLPPFNLTFDSALGAITCFDSSEGLWYVQIGDITLVYNYQMMAWTRYNNINAIKFINYNNTVYFLRDTGSVYRFASREGNQKYYDDYYDVDIDKVIQLPVCAYWTSRNMDFGQPARVKQFRDTYVTTESFEKYNTTVRLKYEVDYVDIYSSFKVVNEISKWDKAKFDVNKFVTRNIDRSLPLMINRRGRTLKVFFGNGYEYFGSLETMPVPGIIPEYQLVYVKDEGKLYLRVPRREGFDNKKDRYFMEFTDELLNEALLVHNISGIYELKGYR